MMQTSTSFNKTFTSPKYNYEEWGEREQKRSKRKGNKHNRQNRDNKRNWE